MKLILYTIFSFLLLLSFSSKAQNAFSVKGSVADTAAASKLHNAAALVLRAKDSIMVKFTRADQEGKFAINNLPAGKYLILITYPEYADYSDSFTLSAANPTQDFGKIKMLLKSKILQDIVIKATPTAIKIKGDTTVFNASAYVVQPNAKVEDLIKQFPGIQVDKDGKVTANGQTVSKFLVDGEEFFGDDPTLVTKNLRADMVKEVQMYDKKSDQATFTGIDDGQKTRTMNVVLREDKKNGYFGKLYGGIGNNDFYTGQVGFNKFQGKEKFAVYGIAANTGKTSLGSDDAQKFGDGGNVTVMDGGGIMISGGGNDLSYDGRGIPTAISGGAHYDNKWAKDKHSINTNYKIGQVDVNGTANTLTQNNLPDRVNNSSSDQKFNRSAYRQKLDATYLWTIDTSATLKIVVDGTLRHSKQQTDYLDITNTDIGYTGTSKLLNYQTRTNINETDQRLMNASAFYTKKLKKKGRTFSALFSNAIDKGTQKGSLHTNLDTYDPVTGVKSNEQVDQYKPATSNTNTFNTNFTYSEPFTKALSLVLNYGLTLTDAKSDQRTYNKSGSGQYDQLDPTFSNNFTLNQLAHQAGAILNYVKGKTTLNFGTRASDVQFKQINELTAKRYERHFINWMPQMTYQYRLGTQSSFRVGYNGSTTQPSLSQLQPIRNNNDPLNQVVGNPDLKPSFRNNFNVYYTSYKALSGQQFYLSGNYSFITNQIVSNNTTDANGKSTIQSVNIGQTPYNYSLTAEASRKLLGINVTLGSSISKNVNYNMVNNVLNTTNGSSFSPYLSFSKYEAKKYDIYLYGGPSYNISKTSLQQNINNNGYRINGNAYLGWYLPADFQITSDMSYNYTSKTQTFDQSNTTFIWNATINKTLLKDKSLKLTATLNDVLNQNNGFSRGTNGSRITQNTYTTIKRFFMLSVIWDFSKMGAAPKK
nr:outer membrane beta-barrel family protein [uncultured Mucilaginibacter sp.]